MVSVDVKHHVYLLTDHWLAHTGREPRSHHSLSLSLSESLPEDRAVAKLQALVYDIVRWRKVAESDAGSVGSAVVVPLHGLWRKVAHCTETRSCSLGLQSSALFIVSGTMFPPSEKLTLRRKFNNDDDDDSEEGF